MSLLEMLLVIALVAAASLLAAMALTGGIDGMRLRSSAKALAAELRFARTQALATGTTQRFEIDPVARQWRGPRGHHGSLPPTIAVQFSGARQAAAAVGAPATTAPATGAIQFFGDGGATGGRIDLATRSAGWRIDVAWVTGEVRITRRPDR